MKYEDLFLNKSNDELKILYDQYIEWSKNGVIPDNELGEIRDKYCDMEPHVPLIILEIDLLKAIAKDWNDSLTQILNVTKNTEEFLNDEEIDQIIEENGKKQNNNLNTFSLEDLKLAKELADLNWDIEDESNVGFEYENRWITNPFVDLNGGQFDFTNLEGMRQYYGKENVDMFLTQILKKDKDAELENYDIDLDE